MKVRFFAIIMILVMLSASGCARTAEVIVTSSLMDKPAADLYTTEIITSEECPHSVWSDTTCVELSKCQECGKTRGQLSPHDYQSDGVTCQEKKVCKVCGREGAYGDHSYVGGDCINPSLCEYCGAQGSLKDHSFDGEQTDADGCVCSVCGDTIDHNMNEATCTEAKVCNRCGYSDGEALGHDGLGTCQRCGEWTPISGNGHGDGVVEKINLGDSGIYVLHMTHSGRRNFIVHSYDASGAKGYLINEIGHYDGTVLFVGTSPMMLNVEADGDWTFEVSLLEVTSDVSFSGSCDHVTNLFHGASGTKVWHFKHDGSSNFAVWLYTAEGRDLLVNEIGVYDADQIVTIPDGLAFFEITADGNWEIYLD